LSIPHLRVQRFTGYAAYPVNRWTRKCGIDNGSVSMLFEEIYE